MLLSISGPGLSPTISIAPSSNAMLPLPGIPKAMVGMRSPPRVALLAASWTEYAFYRALSGSGFVLKALNRMSVRDPLRNVGPLEPGARRSIRR